MIDIYLLICYFSLLGLVGLTAAYLSFVSRNKYRWFSLKWWGRLLLFLILGFIGISSISLVFYTILNYTWYWETQLPFIAIGLVVALLIVVACQKYRLKHKSVLAAFGVVLFSLSVPATAAFALIDPFNIWGGSYLEDYYWDSYNDASYYYGSSDYDNSEYNSYEDGYYY